jgi:hypothetical protein
MDIEFRFGPETIESYRRLTYTPWSAIAEFVDNSTQSFFNNRKDLEAALEEKDERLRIDVSYDKRGSGTLRISDNAMGMNLDELAYAVRVGARPQNQDGRSRYGMGMKTAACWFGNKWSIRTKRLGVKTEYEVTVDVAEIAKGNSGLELIEREKDPALHYTEIEITDLNRQLHGRTIGKVADYLSSMYRVDLTEGWLDLFWQDKRCEWTLFSDEEWSTDPEGNRYFKEFEIVVDEKPIKGWVAVLAGGKGSRAKAGFGILHSNRVIKGWPDSWRPPEIFGQLQGSNNLVNQRVCGEVQLDSFEVTQAKDDIQWYGDQEDQVGEALREIAEDYVQHAQTRRKGDEDSRGPSDVEITSATEEFEEELNSGELADKVRLEVIPDPEILQKGLAGLIEQSEEVATKFSARIGGDGHDEVNVSGRLVTDMSPNDPYFHFDVTKPGNMVILINTRHPHFLELKGSEGVLNHLRNCTYDALAVWKASHVKADLQPITLMSIKDQFLRVGMEIDIHQMEGQLD